MITVDPNVPVGMPPPVPTRLDAGFWEAAARHRLDVQRCAECGRHRYPPTESCYACQSPASTWDTLPGSGVVATFVWLQHAGSGGGGVDGPRYYNVAVIELGGTQGEPVRMLSNVIDAREIGDLAVGDVVELECVAVGEATLPCFRRVVERAR